MSPGVQAAPSTASAISKMFTVAKSIRNWPLLAVDKSGLVERVTYKTRSGYSMTCRSRSTDVNEVVVVVSGLEYDSEFLRLRDGAVVFDLGANIGAFTTLLASINRNIQYGVFAFEPFEENFDLLRLNLTDNDLHNVSPQRLAVTEVDGVVNINVEGDADAVNVVSAGGLPTPSSRMSTFATDHNVDVIELVKMDIEGSEHDVLRSDISFFESSVKRMVLEYHDQGPGRNREAILQLLDPGFSTQVAHGDQTTGIVYAWNRSIN